MTPSLAGAGQARLLLIALCLTAFLDGLDISIVNVALPQIQQQLGFSTDLLGWVISAYAITYSGFVLLGGRTADQFGRRRMFLLALGLFCFANLLGGLAHTPAQLLVARFLMGLAAAFNGPAALSLLTTLFLEGPARTRALGVFSSMAASGFTAGLILGGLLSSLEWRLIFLLPAGVALLALIVSWLVDLCAFMLNHLLDERDRSSTKDNHHANETEPTKEHAGIKGQNEGMRPPPL